MKKITRILATLCLTIPLLTFAQKTETKEKDKCKMSNDFLKRLQENNTVQLSQFLKEQNDLKLNKFGDSKSLSSYKIPVVFYIFDNGNGWTNSSGSFNLYDISDDVIYDALDNLNALFLQDKFSNPYNQQIEFCIATKVGGQDLDKMNAVIAESTILTYNGGLSTVQVGSVDQAPDKPSKDIYNPGIFRIELNSGFNPIGPDDTPDPLSAWVPMTQMMLLDDTEFLRVAIGPGGHGSATIPFSAYGWYGTGDMGIYVNAESFGSPINCIHCDDGLPFGYTFTHEVAHYFGLFHTVYGGLCTGLGAACSSSGDFVCDTEPRSVSFPGLSNCFAPSCDPGNPDVEYDNIMDASDENCVLQFTHGQVERMETTLIAYYSNYYSDCNLKRSGSPCQEELIAGPYCAGFDIQLPYISPDAIYTKISGNGTPNSSGFFSSSQAIAGQYEIELEECGFTQILEFEIQDCELIADFSYQKYGCGSILLTQNSTFPNWSTAKTYNWTFSGGWTTPTTDVGHSSAFGVYESSTGTYYGGPRTVCLDISAYVLGHYMTNQYCEIVYPTCHDQSRLKEPDSNSEDGITIQVFPNPSDGKFQLIGVQKGAKISISNLNGEIVYEDLNTLNDKIDLSNEANGIYFLQVIQNDEIHTTKLIKK